MKKEYLVVVSARVTVDLKKRILRMARHANMTPSEFIGGVLFQEVMEKELSKK